LMSIVSPLGTTKSALTFGAHSKIARKLNNTLEDTTLLLNELFFSIILLLKIPPVF
jgi:hypothetical protein